MTVSQTDKQSIWTLFWEKNKDKTKSQPTKQTKPKLTWVQTKLSIPDVRRQKKYVFLLPREIYYPLKLYNPKISQKG